VQHGRATALREEREAMLSKFDSVMTLLGGQPRLVATWRVAATWLCAGPTKISSQPIKVRQTGMPEYY
jgi:hypothetical protein